MRGRPRVPCPLRRSYRRGCRCDCCLERHRFRARRARRDRRLERLMAICNIDRIGAEVLIAAGFDLRRYWLLTHYRDRQSPTQRAALLAALRADYPRFFPTESHE